MCSLALNSWRKTQLYSKLSATLKDLQVNKKKVRENDQKYQVHSIKCLIFYFRGRDIYMRDRHHCSLHGSVPGVSGGQNRNHILKPGNLIWDGASSLILHSFLSSFLPCFLSFSLSLFLCHAFLFIKLTLLDFTTCLNAENIFVNRRRRKTKEGKKLLSTGSFPKW